MPMSRPLGGGSCRPNNIDDSCTENYNGCVQVFWSSCALFFLPCIEFNCFHSAVNCYTAFFKTATYSHNAYIHLVGRLLSYLTKTKPTDRYKVTPHTKMKRNNKIYPCNKCLPWSHTNCLCACFLELTACWLACMRADVYLCACMLVYMHAKMHDSLIHYFFCTDPVWCQSPWELAKPLLTVTGRNTSSLAWQGNTMAASLRTCLWSVRQQVMYCDQSKIMAGVGGGEGMGQKHQQYGMTEIPWLPTLYFPVISETESYVLWPK